MLLKTLSPKNEFRFACPVFGPEVRLADCLSLRDLYMIGKRPPERIGCQACMSASKCPTMRIMQVIGRSGEDPGLHSAEPRVGSLPGDVLDFIDPIVVSDHLLTQFGVPETERDTILANNERTSSGKSRRAARAPVTLAPVKATAAAKPSAGASSIDETAAVTGDMSAAITKAAKRAAVMPPAAPESVASAVEPVAAAKPRAAKPKPPAAAPAPATPNELTKSLQPIRKAPSLLELARQRREASARS